MSAKPLTNLWRASAREGVVTSALNEALSVDLVVVGGGFTGCCAALEAARKGASVALLEAETIAHGGSGRNVGLVNAGLWLPPEAVIDRLGEAQGMRLIDALSAGPSKVFGLIERENIDCDAVRSGSLHLAHSTSGLADLEDRLRQGNRFGAPLRLLDAEEAARRTGCDIHHGALHDPRAGTIQPLAYCTGLARAAQAAGARLYEHSRAESIEFKDSLWRVTVNGHTVRAHTALLATNAYHQDLAGPFAPKFATVSYSQFATAPLPSEIRAHILPGGEGCWDTALVMSSFRLDRDGRLIVGGMGDLQGPGAAIHGAWAKRKLRQLFPKLGRVVIEHCWSGQIAMSKDYIPKVVAFGPRAYAIFGYSGRGISPGTVFGAAAVEALLEDRPSAFPLEVRDGYAHRFTATESAYYELGATLTHAVQPAPFGRS